VSQLAASTLFTGFFNSGTPSSYEGNPGTIGIQSGFNPGVVAALGGGIQSVAIRVTLSDGDTAAGNFDEHDNILIVNGVNLADFSDIQTQTTSANGQTLLGTQNGFPNNQLATGWFTSTDPSFLTSLYNSISATGQIKLQLLDEVDVYDNFFDFTAGIDGGLLNVGQPPAPANVPPSIVNNELSPALGACDVGAMLGTDDLLSTDPDSSTLTYTLNDLPAGTLLINGEIAGAGATFTQDDINSGYVQLLAGPALGDSFNFSVSDGEGGSTNGTFTAPYAAYDTTQTAPQYGGYWGGNGNDYQLGTVNADNMSGGNGCDLMVGGGGNDQMSGGEGNNRLFGQDGDDNLSGGSGNDLLDGGAGHDQMHANGGNNWLFGGSGNDNMSAGDGNDRMWGGSGSDTIHANGGNNRIDAGADNDTVTTGNGNDTIILGTGNDTVYANGGTNKFQLGGIAGALSDGNDQYTGGSGADKYALFLDDRAGNAAGWGSDTINGFRISEGDQLVAFNSKAGFWDNDADLNSLVSDDWVTAFRGTGGNAGDLTLTFGKNAAQSSVTLKWFFWDNGSFGTTNGNSAISDTQLVDILKAAVQDGGTVGVSGSSFLADAHNYISRDFMLA
jgi:Ca2+-binding RTX toxin-like protein